MKISQKQASLLAREVVKQLEAKKAFKVDDTLRAQIKKFCDKRSELWRKKADVQEEINRHEATLNKIVGRVPCLYTSDSMNTIIEKLERRNVPKQQEIEDEIILQAMFQSEDDMQAFVTKLVTKYSRKLQTKILSN